jgi:hypothetical protein
MPDVVLDYHRLKTPIDHPDGSVTRPKLEYPTVDVSFTYLSAINKVKGVSHRTNGYMLTTYDSFADKSVFAFMQVNDYARTTARISDRYNMYWSIYQPSASTSDHRLEKVVAGTITTLASESIDIDLSGRGLRTSCSGSTIKSMRYELPSPLNPLSLPTPNATLSATDTSFASGVYGFRFLNEACPHGGSESGSVFLLAPASPSLPAQSIVELGVEGNGSLDDPYRPSLSKNLVEVASLTGLPDFLYQEARKYEVLKAKGFTYEEIELLFGYIPQHQVDLDAVTWGSFEFSERSPTNIIMVYGDNLYKSGAVQRQIDYAKSKNARVFAPPKDYNEAVSLYNKLKSDFKHWLAGKDNFAYQVLGLEELDLMQNVDSYYGELIEHKTHYQQLKEVPDWEMRNRLNELRGRLSKVSVLVDERDKHLKKIDEILKRGW